MKNIFAYWILFLGLLLLYRSSLRFSDMIIFNGKVISTDIIKSAGSKGNTYVLVFKLEGKQTPISLLLGSNKQSTNREVVKLIDVGKVYKFYIDPTVITSQGIQGGIRRIDENSKILFQESNAFNLYGGILFIVLAIGLFIVYKFGKKTVS